MSQKDSKFMLEINSILVVCIGNICRSPMGEAFFKQLYPNKKVQSAGLGALVGYPADEHAQSVMKEIDIDISCHVAQQMTEELAKEFDLILCMSEEQERWIKRNWGFTRGKVYRLGHWMNAEIADPYKHPRHIFVKSRDLIQEAVATWRKRII